MKEIGIPGLFSMTTCTHNYCSPYSLLLINLIINYISVYLIYYVGYQSVEYFRRLWIWIISYPNPTLQSAV